MKNILSRTAKYIPLDENEVIDPIQRCAELALEKAWRDSGYGDTYAMRKCRQFPRIYKWLRFNRKGVM